MGGTIAYRTFPSSLEQKWGKKETEEFLQWLEDFLSDRAVTRDEYRESLSWLDLIESRLEHVIHEQVLQRQEFDAFRNEVNERFDRVNERIDQVNERIFHLMKWTVGAIGVVGSLLAILMSIYRFMG